VRIIDYKTGSPQDEKKAKHSLQLSLYALAAQETWGYHPEKLVLYNLEDQSEVETSREPVELQAVRDKVQEVAMAIAAGDFFPTPGYHCGRCDYFDLCPATEQRLYSIATAQAAVGKN
jgi:CRISPR/Cas system-associated exonuclease Cas4 (RecB family)